MTEWIGDMVTDRDGTPCAWVSFESDFGWVVYPLGYFRRCIPAEGEAYTAPNHGATWGGSMPSNVWAVPAFNTVLAWRE